MNQEQRLALETGITEAINPNTLQIDTMPTREIVAAIAAEDATIAAAVAAVGDAIARLADVMVGRMRRGGRLIYVGAGTSGRLGVLDAAECPPTFSSDPSQVVALLAGGPAAMTRAIEGAEDDAEAGARDLAALDAGPNDVLLGIAASGRTPYVLGAMAEARRRGTFVAALVCTQPSALAEAAELTIAPIVGPEVIAGSTRMKAGTATKLALNALSTTVMIKLGKTYGNLMIDVRPTNAKLRQRAARIVAAVADISLEQAQRLLETAGYEPKTAIVMALAKVDADTARARLAENDGQVRRAVEH
jgi:N-acetylmuramic acid 6-phosphate etherase